MGAPLGVKFRIIAVGRTPRGAPTQLLGDDYRQRLHRYGGVEMVEVGEERLAAEREGEKDLILRKQAERLLALVSPGSLMVALHASGRMLSSADLARTLGDWRQGGVREICFLIGGPDGFHPSLLQSASFVLSFGPMTFPHQLIRVLLLEQLYRAMTILNGVPYHR